LPQHSCESARSNKSRTGGKATITQVTRYISLQSKEPKMKSLILTACILACTAGAAMAQDPRYPAVGFAIRQPGGLPPARRRAPLSPAGQLVRSASHGRALSRPVASGERVNPTPARSVRTSAPARRAECVCFPPGNGGYRRSRPRCSRASTARSLCYCCAGGCCPNASYADLADQFELFRRRAKRRVKPSDESAN
jgi:hypothetical protein